jgi:hypothetical protein
VKLLLAIIIAAIVSGCATAYQPIGYAGGFYHQKVSENAYIIGFSGNGFTSNERANDFAKLRAAEIGKKLGFSHFVIDGTLDKSGIDTINTGSTTTTSGNLYGYGNSASFYGTSYTTNNTTRVYKPGVEIGILYSEGIPQGRHLEVFVVQDVLNELKAKYNITP